MTKSVQTLDWQSSPDGHWGALVAVDSSVDTIWIINLLTSQPAQFSENNARPRFVVVDNIANNAIAFVAFGVFVFAVSQYTRKTFPIPAGTRGVTVTATVGTVNVFITTDLVPPDDSNQLAIITASQATVLYTPVTYSGTVTAALTDNNKQIIFVPTIANMLYNLRAIGTTPIASGWLSFVANRGTKTVTITPAGADVINQLASLVLGPGDSGYIFCDGATWYFFGHLSFDSAEFAVTSATVLAAVNHGMGKIPDVLEPWLRCKVANLNYAIGDEVRVSILSSWSGFGPAVLGAWANTTQLGASVPTGIPANNFSLAAKGTGVQTSITDADWKFFIRARAVW